jgi:hypothetical protein
MGIELNLRHDIFKIEDTLDDLSRKQIPFASARGLTELAVRVRNDETALLKSRFYKATPFTQNAMSMTAATKKSQRAMVFVKDIQAGYLAINETGGIRTPPKTALIAPVEIGLNAYGNIPKGMLQRLKRDKNVFVANIKGTGGIWERGPFRSLRLLVAFIKLANYKPIFGYHIAAMARVTRDAPSVFKASMASALKNSKR